MAEYKFGQLIQEEEDNYPFQNILTENKRVPFVDRIINPSQYPSPTLTDEEGRKQTHFMSADTNENNDWIVYPKIIFKDGEYKRVNMDQAINSGNFINFGKDQELATDFSANYKTKNFKEFYQEESFDVSPIDQDGDREKEEMVMPSYQFGKPYEPFKNDPLIEKSKSRWAKVPDYIKETGISLYEQVSRLPQGLLKAAKDQAYYDLLNDFDAEFDDDADTSALLNSISKEKGLIYDFVRSGIEKDIGLKKRFFGASGPEFIKKSPEELTESREKLQSLAEEWRSNWDKEIKEYQKKQLKRYKAAGFDEIDQDILAGTVSVPLSLTGLGLAYVTRNPALLNSTVPIFGTLTFASAYEESVARGLNAKDALANAKIQGSSEMLTEIGGNYFISNGLKKFFKGRQKDAVKNILKNGAASFIVDSASEQVNTLFQSSSNAYFDIQDEMRVAFENRNNPFYEGPSTLDLVLENSKHTLISSTVAGGTLTGVNTIVQLTPEMKRVIKSKGQEEGQEILNNLQDVVVNKDLNKIAYDRASIRLNSEEFADNPLVDPTDIIAEEILKVQYVGKTEQESADSQTLREEVEAKFDRVIEKKPDYAFGQIEQSQQPLRKEPGELTSEIDLDLDPSQSLTVNKTQAQIYTTIPKDGPINIQRIESDNYDSEELSIVENYIIKPREFNPDSLKGIPARFSDNNIYRIRDFNEEESVNAAKAFIDIREAGLPVDIFSDVNFMGAHVKDERFKTFKAALGVYMPELAGITLSPISGISNLNFDNVAGSKIQARDTLIHELGHHIDYTIAKDPSVQDKSVYAPATSDSPLFEIPKMVFKDGVMDIDLESGGAVMKEGLEIFHSTISNPSDYYGGHLLGYPLGTLIANGDQLIGGQANQVKSELFAQMNVLYYTNRSLMESMAPQTLKLIEDINNGISTDRTATKNQNVRIAFQTPGASRSVAVSERERTTEAVEPVITEQEARQGLGEEARTEDRDNIRSSIPQLNNTSLLDFIKENPKGFTVDPETLESPSSGFAVAPVKALEIVVDQNQINDDILQSYVDNIKELSDRMNRDVFAGGWLNKDNGKYYLDATVVFDTMEDALYVAEAAEQEAIFDLGTFNETTTEQGIQELEEAGRLNSQARDEQRSNIQQLSELFESTRNLGSQRQISREITEESPLSESEQKIFNVVKSLPNATESDINRYTSIESKEINNVINSLKEKNLIQDEKRSSIFKLIKSKTTVPSYSLTSNALSQLEADETAFGAGDDIFNLTPPPTKVGKPYSENFPWTGGDELNSDLLLQKFLTKLQNMYVRQNVVEEVIEDQYYQGILKDRDLSVVDDLDLMKSIVGDKQMKSSEEMEQMLEKMFELANNKYSNIRDFLYNLHAPERNKNIYKKRKQKLDERIEKYGPNPNPAQKGKITQAKNQLEPFKNNGSGIETDQALKTLKETYGVEFNVKTGKAKAINKTGENYLKISDLAQEYIGGTRKIYEEAGLVDKRNLDDWDATYNYYVPLSGFAADTTVDGFPNNKGKGISVYGLEVPIAKGRTSLAGDTIIQIYKQRENAIVREGKNNVVKKLADQARVFTNPEVYEVVDKVPTKAKYKPEWDSITQEGYVFFKEDGKQKAVRIKDERLAKAFQHLDFKGLDAVSRYIGIFTRLMSVLNTGYNPDFPIPNFSRDIFAATAGALGEQDVKGGRIYGSNIAFKAVKGVFPRIGELYTYYRKGPEFIKDPVQRELAKKYHEMGSKTSYFEFLDTDKLTKNFTALEKYRTGKLSARDLKRFTLDLISDINNVIENGIRFSQFTEFVKDRGGLNDISSPNLKRAAVQAKNSSINFDRAGEWAAKIGAYIMFFNPAVQGSDQFMRGQNIFTKRGRRRLSPQKLAFTGLGGATIGMYMTILNLIISDEDEDGDLVYNKIPDYEKARNLLLLMPDELKYDFGEGFEVKKFGETKEYITPGNKPFAVTIPLSYGYNVHFNLGRLFVETQAHKLFPDKFDKPITSIEKAGYELADAFVTSFSPIAGVTTEKTGIEGLVSRSRSFLPSAVFRPLADIAANETFFGGPITKPDNPYGPKRPKFTKALRSTNEIYKDITRELNEFTGGNDYTSGWLDVDPNNLQYFLEYHLGGGGRSVERVATLPKKIIDGTFDKEDVTILRSFTAEPREFVNGQIFYKNKEEVEELVDEYTNLKGEEKIKFAKENNMDIVRLGDIRTDKQKKSDRKRSESYQKRREPKLKIAEEKLANIRDKIKTATNLYQINDPDKYDKLLRQYKEEEQEVYLEFNKEYNKRSGK